MVTKWTVGDLAPDHLFEVIQSRDLDSASRFSWPIANLLDENGEPLIMHDAMFVKPQKDGSQVDPKTGRKNWRFKFHNHKDNATQAVKIDGTGCIMYMSPSAEKAALIKKIVRELGADQDGCDPDIIKQAIREIYLQTGIADTWHSSKSDLDKKYDASDDVEDHFGRYVYKETISSAIYLGGQGLFEGPTETPQSFHGGGFILFPDKNIEEARQVISNFDPLRSKETSGGAKHVAYDVFLETRRLPDGTPIIPSEQKRQDKPKKRYHKISPVAGFPDASDLDYAQERRWIAQTEALYASFGYSRIKTRTMEDLGVLRLEEGEDESDSQIFEVIPFKGSTSQRFGLRFDHTVPLARYIAENKGSNKLVFPFKSARIGSVFREREVMRGASREYIQADIDVVGTTKIDAHYDIELPRIMVALSQELQLGTLQISISNRKITKGFFESLGLDNDIAKKIIRLIELRDTLGIDGIRAKIIKDKDIELDKEIIETCMSFARIKTSDTSFEDQLKELCEPNALMEEGIEELKAVIEGLSDLENCEIRADLSVVRGMEYYTGTVYEARSNINPTYPPIMVGGRYDNMVSHFMKDSHPGVGFSFELSSALKMVRDSDPDLLESSNQDRSQVLVAFESAVALGYAEHHAQKLRGRGFNVEIAYGADHPKQLQYADRKQIPYVLEVNNDGQHEMRDMNLDPDNPNKVIKVDLSTWQPKLIRPRMK